LNSPEQAKELFANEPDRINVLITDMVMPRQSGPELAQELLSRRPNLNVIFISGYCEKPPTVAAPVVQFIRKPFSSKELLNCVRALSVGPDLK
jgi:two-component system cell cycle sensor histidine kinase/response regulator CckA